MTNALPASEAGGVTPRLSDDIYRFTGGRGATRGIKLFLRDRCFRPLVTLRLRQATRDRKYGRLLLPVIWLVHRANCRRAGIELPLHASIGPALAIHHGWGLVVNGKARIGANVTLLHGVTLGQADRIAEDGARTTGYPVIEDDVWIGPHAVVVGPVRIGRGSRILANSVVADDVPSQALVGGIPARVLREDCLPDVMHRVELPGV